MSDINLSGIDIGIIIAYLVLCLVIGLKKYGKIKTIRDYTLGSKPFATAVLIATTFATAIEARQVIGYTGKAYDLGMVFIIPALFSPMCWFIMAKLYLPDIELFRQKKFLTLSDIMEYWYGKTARWVTNISAIFVTMGISAISITAIGYLLHYFLHIPEIYGMLIGLFAVTIYSAFGGIQAVAFTDVFQFLIFFIAIPCACIIGLNKAGGIKEVIEALPPSHLTIDRHNITLFFSLILYALIPYGNIPYIQRVLIAKDVNQFKKTFITVGILMLPLLVTTPFIGLITYKINPNINSNTALFYFIDNCLSPGVVGIVIAGLLAVIMSTQDSFLNTTSVLIARDVCKQIWPQITDKQELRIARVSCIIISTVSALLVFLEKDILNIVWLVANFWDALVTVPLLVGLMGIKISNRSFLVLILSTLIAEIITRFITGAFDTVSLMVGAITAVIIVFIANRMYKKQNPELFPLKNSKALFYILKEIALENNFSLSSQGKIIDY